MQPVSGPFPIDEGTKNPSFHQTTEDERGLMMLAYFLRCADDDRYQDQEGWQRFNTGAAPQMAGGLIRDVLTYVLCHAGGVDGVRAALETLVELADVDAEYTDGEGIAAVLQDAVPSKRLTQIEDAATAQGKVLARLAAHLGVRTDA
ncbi:hypothetical protein ABZ468_50145 [Streptomyces sp. NPDC005708]|uniref:hypothetical protein n=1 Tax=Streptomyces sp. NPDC005708 TaxID=3154564 RepID=UPI0033D26889